MSHVSLLILLFISQTCHFLANLSRASSKIFLASLLCVCLVAEATPTSSNPRPLMVKVGGGGIMGGSSSSYQVGEFYFDSTRQKWVLTVRIGIYGLGNFINIEPLALHRFIQDRQAMAMHNQEIYGVTLGVTPEIGHFTRIGEVNSIENLGVAGVIESQIQMAQDAFSGDHVEANFKVHFLDESASAPSEVPMSEFGVPRKTSTGETLIDFLPINYSLEGTRGALSPSSWTPWVTGWGVAHELFHWLSHDMFNDGYIYGNYPLNSIMNSEFEFLELLRRGLGPAVLQPFELNTLLSRQLGVKVGEEIGDFKADIDNPERDSPKYFNSMGFNPQYPDSIARKVEIFQNSRYPGLGVKPYLPSQAAPTLSRPENNRKNFRVEKVVQLDTGGSLVVMAPELFEGFQLGLVTSGSTTWFEVTNVIPSQGHSEPTTIHFLTASGQQAVLSYYSGLGRSLPVPSLSIGSNQIGVRDAGTDMTREIFEGISASCSRAFGAQ